MRIALVSMPWRKSIGPAIGLSNLKAIAQDHPDTICDIHYLNIAWQKTVESALSAAAARDGLPLNQLYSKILDLAHIRHSAEWMFALEAFPETRMTADLYIEEYRKGALSHELEHSEYILEAAKLVREFLDECFSNIAWNTYDVIGFECLYFQLSPSLALAKRLKQAFPDKTIILGGHLCEGDAGAVLLKRAAFVDAVFDGEAEDSFREFVRQRGDCSRVNNVWYRRDGEIACTAGKRLVEVESLPTPNFDDFAPQRARFHLLDGLAPTYPIEGSRGCWWGVRHHCVFCGLNATGIGYRAKSTQRILRDIAHIVDGHGVRRLQFTDSIMSTKVIEEVCDELISTGANLSLWGSVKSNMSRRAMKKVKRSGFVALQPGVESLSTDVLKYIDKGVTTLTNVAMLKFAREAKVGPLGTSWSGFRVKGSRTSRRLLK